MKTSNNDVTTLSTDVIKDIPFDKYDQNFTFIVNGKEYKINRIVADILSPIIRRYHFIDETIDKYIINIPNLKTDFDFSNFLSLITFNPKTLTKEEKEYFLNIFSILGNKTEFLRIAPKYEGENTTKNVVNNLQNKIQYISNFQSKFTKENDDNSIFLNEIEYLQPELDHIKPFL